MWAVSSVDRKVLMKAASKADKMAAKTVYVLAGYLVV